MLKLGLTGGIGSGKTTISKMFEKLGCNSYNSDERAKRLYFHPEIKIQVIELLGKQVYISETEIDKNYVFDIIFNDKSKLDSLNSIFIPFIKEDFKEFTKSCFENSIVLLESATLFESGIYQDLDYNILVTSPEHIRIERVIERNKISREKVEQCIRNQWTDGKKLDFADFVISNINFADSAQEVLKIMKVFSNI
jgi:dephospho-CoA kinase